MGLIISKLAKEIKPSATLGQPDTGPSEDVLPALLEGGKLHKYGPVQGDFDEGFT